MRKSTLRTLKYCNYREKLSHLNLVNRREGLACWDLWVQRKEPHGWCAGKMLRALGQGHDRCWWLVLGELKEVETGAVALLCCREDADRKWEKRVRPFILPSYLQHACPIDRTCQEACWQRSLINECKPQYYRGKCRIMSLGSEIIINRPCYRNNKTAALSWTAVN